MRPGPKPKPADVIKPESLARRERRERRYALRAVAAEGVGQERVKARVALLVDIAADAGVFYDPSMLLAELEPPAKPTFERHRRRRFRAWFSPEAADRITQSAKTNRVECEGNGELPGKAVAYGTW